MDILKIVLVILAMSISLIVMIYLDKADKNIEKSWFYSKELKIIANRFDMTEIRAYEFIIHEVYKSKCCSQGLVKAFKLLEDYDEMAKEVHYLNAVIIAQREKIKRLESIIKENDLDVQL